MFIFIPTTEVDRRSFLQWKSEVLELAIITWKESKWEKILLKASVIVCYTGSAGTYLGICGKHSHILNMWSKQVQFCGSSEKVRCTLGHLDYTMFPSAVNSYHFESVNSVLFSLWILETCYIYLLFKLLFQQNYLADWVLLSKVPLVKYIHSKETLE